MILRETHSLSESVRRLLFRVCFGHLPGVGEQHLRSCGVCNTTGVRSVEGGILGDIVPVGATKLDEDGNLASTGPWSKDARCTLYLDLE